MPAIPLSPGTHPPTPQTCELPLSHSAGCSPYRLRLPFAPKARLYIALAVVVCCRGVHLLSCQIHWRAPEPINSVTTLTLTLQSHSHPFIKWSARARGQRRASVSTHSFQIEKGYLWCGQKDMHFSFSLTVIKIQFKKKTDDMAVISLNAFIYICQQMSSSFFYL